MTFLVKFNFIKGIQCSFRTLGGDIEQRFSTFLSRDPPKNLGCASRPLPLDSPLKYCSDSLPGWLCCYTGAVRVFSLFSLLRTRFSAPYLCQRFLWHTNLAHYWPIIIMSRTDPKFHFEFYTPMERGDCKLSNGTIIIILLQIWSVLCPTIGYGRKESFLTVVVQTADSFGTADELAV